MVLSQLCDEVHIQIAIANNFKKSKKKKNNQVKPKDQAKTKHKKKQLEEIKHLH